jgi:hypothetical protein
MGLGWRLGAPKSTKTAKRAASRPSKTARQTFTPTPLKRWASSVWRTTRPQVGVRQEVEGRGVAAARAGLPGAEISRRPAPRAVQSSAQDGDGKATVLFCAEGSLHGDAGRILLTARCLHFHSAAGERLSKPLVAVSGALQFDDDSLEVEFGTETWTFDWLPPGVADELIASLIQERSLLDDVDPRRRKEIVERWQLINSAWPSAGAPTATDEAMPAPGRRAIPLEIHLEPGEELLFAVPCRLKHQPGKFGLSSRRVLFCDFEGVLRFRGLAELEEFSPFRSAISLGFIDEVWVISQLAEWQSKELIASFDPSAIDRFFPTDAEARQRILRRHAKIARLIDDT